MRITKVKIGNKTRYRVEIAIGDAMIVKLISEEELMVLKSDIDRELPKEIE